MTPRAAVALLVATCLVLTGCTSGQRKAEMALKKLKPAMTRDEVRFEIGDPDRMVKIEPTAGIQGQTVEVWEYSYSGTEVDITDVVLVLAAAFAVAVVVIMAAGSKGGSGGLGGLGGGGGGGGGSSSQWRFCIGFGEDGRVRNVSVLEPVKR
jgi:uncharacterized membrane protein YgcG